VSLPLISDLRASALFLDLDGTLANIVEEPAKVNVTRQTLAALSSLNESLAGALAIVSGRTLEDIDRLLDPLRLPLAGVHGTLRRSSDGSLHRSHVDEDIFRDIIGHLGDRLGAEKGIFVEPKPGAVAVHYRARPDLEMICHEVLQGIVTENAGLRLQRGKMVAEVLAEGINKGEAIRAFLSESPFIGRRPIFVGDDVTDESGFAAVNDAGGVSIKIGAGETLAQFRIEKRAQFQDWLIGLSQTAESRANI
jgi:trehalose 6-phosphate phosphatase